MKRLICMLLLVLLCAAATFALADSPRIGVTQDFLAAMAGEGMTSEFMGPSTEGDEHVMVEVDEGEFYCLLYIRIPADGEAAEVLVRDVIYFDPADETAVRRAVNGLNSSYRYTRFFVDEESGAVACMLNLFLPAGDGAGEYVLDGVERVISILRETQPVLAPYGM